MTDVGLRRTHKTTGPTYGRAPQGFWFIYFFGNEDGAEVKVGKTRQNVWERRQQHENQNGRDLPMRTLAVVLGQGADEAHVKRHFSGHRSRARSPEWLHANPTVRSYLKWLRSHPFVATSEDEMHVLTPVDSSMWLPGEGRERQAFQLRLPDNNDSWADLAVDHVMEGDFYTHPSIVEAARKAMGTIDLDPASCREANEVVRAETYYGFHDNGLLHDWQGNVWANPPYGMWEDWVPKIVQEWNSGRVRQMCVIAPTRTLTAKQLHPLVQVSNAMAILRGRVPFWGPKATNSPDDGHVVFYVGPNKDAFAQAFEPIGTAFYESAA